MGLLRMGYEILDNRNNTDLEKGYFASLSAVEAVQFGNVIYSTVLKFKDLSDFLSIFPEVQRDISPRKVASIRRYILTASDENLRFFSSITVTSRSHAFYDKINNRLALDVANTKLSINDGQHRAEGIRTALSYLEKEFAKTKSKEKAEKLRKQIDSLEEMAIPMVIFTGISESIEKTLFHDLNNLAQRPSRNANIKLNQSDYFARLSRELSEKNRYLDFYGIEKNKTSIHPNNPNTILLTTIYNSLKVIYNKELKMDKNFINNDNYESIFDDCNKWFDDVLNSLPNDLQVKNKYVLSKSYGITMVFKFIMKMLDEGRTKERALEVVKATDFTIENPVWFKYGAVINKHGNLEFSGTTGGSRAILNLLVDKEKEFNALLL